LTIQLNFSNTTCVISFRISWKQNRLWPQKFTVK